MRLDEDGDLATMRLWFEFGEPAPTRQALELATAALLGIVRELLGRQWEPLSLCFTHRAPASLDAHRARFGPRLQFGPRVHRAGLLRRPSSTPPNTASDPLLPALRRPAAHGTRRSAGRDGDRAGDATGRDAAARRPVLDPPGGPQPGRDAADAAPAAGRGGRVVLGDRAHASARRWPSATCRPTATRSPTSRSCSVSPRPSAFSRWFRLRFGVSPTQWRAAARQPAGDRATSAVVGPAPNARRPAAHVDSSAGE